MIANNIKKNQGGMEPGVSWGRPEQLAQKNKYIQSLPRDPAKGKHLHLAGSVF